MFQMKTQSLIGSGSIPRDSNSPIKNIHEAVGSRLNEVQLANEVKHLKGELNFQVNINHRLSKELLECQRRLGIDPSDPRLKAEDQQNIMLTTDLSFLAPLFTAYDERISSLDNMVDTLIDDLKEQDKKLKHLIDDNMFLRDQLDKKTEQLLQLHQHGGGAESLQSVFSRLEREELQERIRLLNEENQLYITKVKEYEGAIFGLRGRNEIYGKHEQSYVNEIHELQEQVKKLEIDGDDLRVRREVLENKLRNQVELNAMQEEERNEVLQKLSRAENEVKVLRHQIGSLRHALESSSEGQSAQLSELHKELEQMKLRERDVFNKQVYSEREIDQLKDDNRRLRKEVELAKTDLDQTMKMMENYENKIQLFQKKEENVVRVSKDLRDRMEQINLDRDKLALRESHFEQTLQSLSSKQRDEIQQLKLANDKTLEQVKARQRALLEQRDDEIHRLQDENTQINILNERYLKENKSLKAELNRLESNLRSDIESTHQHTDDLLRQITELTEKLQLSEQANQDNQNQHSSEKAQLEAHIKNTQNSNADLRQALDHTRAQLTSTTQELSTLKGKISQLTRQNQTLIEELQKTKKYNEQRLEGLQDEYTYKMKHIQTSLDEAVKREKNSRERAVQLLQQYDQIEEKLKAEYSARISDLEYQLAQTRNQNKALQTKVQEYGTLRK